MNSRYDTDLRQWVSPFGYLRINAYLPTPRSFSQAIASFIACDRQGIHHVHLVTWSYNLISYSHSRCCAFYSATPSSLLELTLCRSSNGYSSSLRIESCASTDVETSIQSARFQNIWELHLLYMQSQPVFYITDWCVIDHCLSLHHINCHWILCCASS